MDFPTLHFLLLENLKMRGVMSLGQHQSSHEDSKSHIYFWSKHLGALAIHLGRKENDPVYKKNRIENHTYLSTSDMRTTLKV
jgi:hypothetical protein